MYVEMRRVRYVRVILPLLSCLEQVAMRYALFLLRISVLLCLPLRENYLLPSLPLLLPHWTVWVPRPHLAPPRPLLRPSKTIQVWQSLSLCSLRAGQRSSYGDHQVCNCTSTVSKPLSHVVCEADISVTLFLLC